MEIALVEVYWLSLDCPPKVIERFLIQYHQEMYPSPDALRAEIKKRLERYIDDMKIDNLKVRYVALQVNQFVGHFFESEHCPKGVTRQRTFSVGLALP